VRHLKLCQCGTKYRVPWIKNLVFIFFFCMMDRRKWANVRYTCYYCTMVRSSVADLWHFAMDPDQVPPPPLLPTPLLLFLLFGFSPQLLFNSCIHYFWWRGKEEKLMSLRTPLTLNCHVSDGCKSTSLYLAARCSSLIERWVFSPIIVYRALSRWTEIPYRYVLGG
jgi:hypothetical protein